MLLWEIELIFQRTLPFDTLSTYVCIPCQSCSQPLTILCVWSFFCTQRQICKRDKIHQKSKCWGLRIVDDKDFYSRNTVTQLQPTSLSPKFWSLMNIILLTILWLLLLLYESLYICRGWKIGEVVGKTLKMVWVHMFAHIYILSPANPGSTYCNVLLVEALVGVTACNSSCCFTLQLGN